MNTSKKIKIKDDLKKKEKKGRRPKRNEWKTTFEKINQNQPNWL